MKIQVFGKLCNRQQQHHITASQSQQQHRKYHREIGGAGIRFNVNIIPSFTLCCYLLWILIVISTFSFSFHVKSCVRVHPVSMGIIYARNPTVWTTNNGYCTGKQSLTLTGGGIMKKHSRRIWTFLTVTTLGQAFDLPVSDILMDLLNFLFNILINWFNILL